MKNKKKINQEIERKKKTSRLLSNVIAIVCVVALVAAVAWVAVDSRGLSYIVNFEGNRIPVSDIHFHAAGAGVWDLSDPDQAQMAIEELIAHEVIVHQLGLVGIEPTAESIEEATITAMMGRMEWGIHPAVTDERVGEMIAWRALLPELADYHIPEYNLTFADLATEFEEYFEANQEFYELNVTETLFITTPDLEGLQGLSDLAEMADEINFPLFVESMSVAFDPEVGQDPVPVTMFLNVPELFEHFEDLSNMQTGDISGVMSLGEDENGVPMFLMVYMQSRNEIDMDQIQDDFVTRTADSRREDAFFDLLEQWTANANYTVNQRVVDAL